jgi:hypothetical protein
MLVKSMQDTTHLCLRGDASKILSRYRLRPFVREPVIDFASYSEHFLHRFGRSGTDRIDGGCQMKAALGLDGCCNLSVRLYALCALTGDEP